ncbi:hypothetical protein [Intrasporangium flavum]|nr:hypothetical protein [Intrasporangium flavum]
MAGDRRGRLGYYTPLVIAVVMLVGLLVFLVTIVHEGALFLWDSMVH